MPERHGEELGRRQLLYRRSPASQGKHSAMETGCNYQGKGDILPQLDSGKVLRHHTVKKRKNDGGQVMKPATPQFIM